MNGKKVMRYRAFQRASRNAPQISCLECQFLHQPNPEEDELVCLKTLQRVAHEIDCEFECDGFQYISPYWVPVYDSSKGMYF